MLRSYLRFGVLAGLVALIIGLGMLLSVAFSQLLGYDFSYYVFTPPANSDLPIPPVPDERSLDLVHGIALSLVALIFTAVHWLGLLRAETAEERQSSGLSKTSNAVAAVVVGVMTLVALASGTTSLAGRILLADKQHPGPSLALGLVAGVVWMWFFVRVVRQLRQSQRGRQGAGLGDVSS